MALLSQFRDSIGQAALSVHEAIEKTKTSVAQKERDLGGEGPQQHVDISIQFIGASDLPPMDLTGAADPYFRASLDDKLQYISTVKANSLAPVWNERWNIKNVPTTAKLEVRVFDKDVGPRDDVIGQFHTDITPGAKELTIESILTKRSKGTFWLKIESREPSHTIDQCPPYTFDGPVSYSRHFSPTVGLLTALNDERLYSTWKIYAKGVPMFFGDTVQGWNKDYAAAQRIFGPGPESIALRSAIRSAHSILYARTTRNDFGVIETRDDALHLFQGTLRGEGQQGGLALPRTGAGEESEEKPQPPQRIKPAVYTYIIGVSDSAFRFSETGAAFLVDFASKHALHANCAEAVRYSGEFHPRPLGGWQNFSDDIPDDQVEWELLIDNNSGTYSPKKADLPRVRMCMEYSFPGIRVRALDREDPELKESVEACRNYALEFRGVATDELQPHAHQNGEKSIQQMINNGELKVPSENQVMGEGAGSITA